jgi:hypothetical protein
MDAIVVGMEWLRAHPYAATIAAVAVVIVVGVIFIGSHTPAALQSSSITWSGGAPVTAYQNNYSYGQPANPQQIAAEVVQGGQGVNVAIPQIASSTPAQSGFTAPSGSFDYTQLLAALSAQGQTRVSGNTTSGNANAVIQEAYQFIPQGLVATTASATKPKTALQQALYDYGNEIGSEIQSFEELHTDQTQVIKDQAEDRTNPAKAAAVVSLGQALASVGTFMQGMQDVPPSVQTLHSALAKSYSDIGAKLQSVAQAESDQDFVQAVETYDTSAGTFVNNYASLAQYFSAQGVVFAQQDPGSVFSFNQSGGL